MLVKEYAPLNTRAYHNGRILKEMKDEDKKAAQEAERLRKQAEIDEDEYTDEEEDRSPSIFFFIFSWFIWSIC
uniref:Uncharacterized protein n=1 Tax=Panagrolaimus sp. PS1159 TaxID=55785 RepID=A0AC35FBE4_9BILA